MKRFIGISLASTLILGFVGACGGGDQGSSQDGDGGAAQAPTTQSAPAPTGPAAIEVDPAILPEGVTVAMVQEGQQVFQGPGICYTCHTQAATGGPLAPDLTDDTWINVDGEYGSIVELVKTGVPQPVEHPGAMLPRAGMPLTDDQVAAVASYVYILSR